MPFCNNAICKVLLVLKNKCIGAAAAFMFIPRQSLKKRTTDLTLLDYCDDDGHLSMYQLYFIQRAEHGWMELKEGRTFQWRYACII